MKKCDNVIPFPGGHKKDVPIVENVNGISVPKNGPAYLALLKEQLELLDYENILCAILDYDYYLELDHDLQMIVLKYFTFRP